MVKRDVSELKKQLKKTDTCIDRIYGCYVNHEKEKVLMFQKSFLSLPEEDMFKYSDIFAKALSGTIGKSLFNLSFPLKAEEGDGCQKQLLDLRDSELKDEEMAEDLCDRIIGCYEEAGAYFILLAHGTYDIPGKASDGSFMEDASDNVYSFLLCMICPMELSKPGLYYNPVGNVIENKTQDFMVKPPKTAFLFPAFNERNTDIHNTLYFSKNAKELHDEFITEILGCETPMAAEAQKDAFTSIVEETFGLDCDLDKVKLIQEKINTKIVESEEEGCEAGFDKSDMRRFFSECGADNAALERFDNVYDDKTEQDLLAQNISDVKKMEVKSTDVKITVDSKRTDLIETRMIDGVEYIVIPVTNGLAVNGIHLKSRADGKDSK